MQNITMFQFFNWYYPDEGHLWNHCADQAAHLASLGVTHVWLPPAYKSSHGTQEPGYAPYDHFDLGEFDQKGSVRTKYGTKEEYLNCIKALHDNGIQVIADIVLNHKHGADETELVKLQQVDREDRNQKIGEPVELDVYTKFTFPGRGDKYSNFKWDYQCFTGVEMGLGDDHKIYLILNGHADEWEEMVDDEKGNFDFLMANDIEFRNPHVREELKWWGQWYVDTTGIDGFRLDAVKHITPHFYLEWLDHLNNHFQKQFFVVGEFWRQHVEPLLAYLDVMQNKLSLFDVPLHYNFYAASHSNNEYDLRKIFDGTLIQARPYHAISFVDNHDTQPLQALESTVDYWFKLHGYALTMLRLDGIPCVFYPAIYGSQYEDQKDGEKVFVDLVPVMHLDKIMWVRKELAYGGQRDYFDHANTVGWVRYGVPEKKNSGCAVLISNGEDGDKEMELGPAFARKTFVDITHNRQEKVKLDKNGKGKFFVSGRSVSVWVNAAALK